MYHEIIKDRMEAGLCFREIKNIKTVIQSLPYLEAAPIGHEIAKDYSL
jgi:hypothetical protein